MQGHEGWANVEGEFQWMRIPLVSGRGSDGLAGNDDLHPPVLLSTDGRIIAGHWIRGSHAHGT